ncbi:hypothetical protein AN639_06150 [Candidatus Epulonipiscium fishelsonii]|uniref:Uncharacterized protein n=1 Tax=Candidatus Epulonipiscium fishelsonii TaxID=77094 RepID=A0ACC8X9Q7_9FIRM|nr:hypothetical protein AN396_09795 [Epulopiscium sp. SCG-B11WGA-EpuloA1]ONI39328.1 hypothetical protein AN639_06150 [Epulopiscium sp. SCG-B05WGA-EpuloA1]
MKSIFVLCLIFKYVNFAFIKKVYPERFYITKCVFYLLASSVSSVVLGMTIPLGAVIMFILYLNDSHNKHVKLTLILTGFIIVMLSSISFESVVAPIQNYYLQSNIEKTTEISIYSYTPHNEEFLSTIRKPELKQEFLDNLMLSEPVISLNSKVIPQDHGYKIILHQGEIDKEIILSDVPLNNINIFVGPKFVTYSNPHLLSLVESMFPTQPSELLIRVDADTTISITNNTVLNILWRNILWAPKDSLTKYIPENFAISANINFSSNLTAILSFTEQFDYVYVDNLGVIHLSAYLQNMLYEQFILTQGKIVHDFTTFEPAHIHTEPQTSQRFYLESNEEGSYVGLYSENYKTGERTFLHSVTSENAKFFILKYPYILLLDEKAVSQSYLMIINQNIPEKHRYLARGINVLSKSIALCPNNTKFSYIVQNQENSMLFYVADYYQAPEPIVSGNIMDSLFLTERYIVFTQKIDDDNLLCIYDVDYERVIKYTYIPGEIHLIESSNNEIKFAVQSTSHLTLKEGIFSITPNLEINAIE